MQKLELEDLVGSMLDRCQFSKSGYTFEFSNSVDGNCLRLKLHTSYFVAVGESSENDILENFSNAIWPFLERQVSRVRLDENAATLKLKFDSGIIKIWPGDLPFMDNLAILEDANTGFISTVL